MKLAQNNFLKTTFSLKDNLKWFALSMRSLLHKSIRVLLNP